MVLAAAALLLALAGTAYAFHSGGVAECSGCHSMHAPKASGSFLLIGGDQSSTCLTCHQQTGLATPSSYHIATADADMPAGVPPKQRTPGGDFGWLKKTYTWAGRGAGVTETEYGYSHGHNIVASEGFSSTGAVVTYGYTVDPVNTNAPGGGAAGYPAANLGCTSCHDPHGRARRNLDGTITTNGLPITASGSYNNAANTPASDTSVGAYRILAGPGYASDGVTFTGAPDAIAPSTYNQTEATNQVKVAYAKIALTGHNTWSQWCGTCHGDMHFNNGARYVHPTDRSLGGTIRANYNKYKHTGDLSGTEPAAFTSLVPFVYNEPNATPGDYTVLKAKAGNGSPTYEGPTSDNDRVDCLSCHRAHASGWEFGLRWNPEYELITDASGAYFNGSFGGRGHPTADVQAAYYDRPASTFGKVQRSLCNKCHIKD